MLGSRSRHLRRGSHWGLLALMALALVSAGSWHGALAGAKGKGKVAKPAARPGDPALWASIEAAKGNYDKARWHPIHFRPLIDRATNEQCLACHKEILEHEPRKASPAGWRADRVLAWYQTLDTYEGPQMTFHARHLTSPFAKQVMDLKCNFCHQGNDPREEAPGSHAENVNDSTYTLRKTVDPSKTCLRCHGKFPFEFMEGLEDDWSKIRKDFEDEETPNGCLAACHGETFRTVRHQVTYLKPENIEKLAQKSSDVCYGCHGGRRWYRISYPYPRNPWPGMKDVVPETPEWAKNRPTQSEARYRRK